MVPAWLIEKKRDGAELTPAEIEFFIAGYSGGSIPDYQMAALAMAIFFQGMSADETVTLTRCMLESGSTLPGSGDSRKRVDKHSTGGIGDKVSLVLAPLAAAVGMAVPMISGRGLGITGGTLDKLESIPGYRTDLSELEIEDIVQKCGCCITGQTGDIAPADKKLYALRDVTATVPSVPLITASILSKKLAANLDALVLDVKCGSGAMMKDLNSAEELCNSLVSVAAKLGTKTGALISSMNRPLGRTAGNAVEVIEAVETLQGKGPADFQEICIELVAGMGQLSGVELTKQVLLDQIASGRAFEIFLKMVELQGGDPRALEDLKKLPKGKFSREIKSESSGYISDVNAEKVGRAALLLGAGRLKSDDAVSFGAGVSELVQVGEELQAGEKLCTLHADSQEKIDDALEYIEAAFSISENSPDPGELILTRQNI